MRGFCQSVFRVWRQRGLALISSLMLMLFASVAVLGVTVFITQRLAQSVSSQAYSRCLYNAQAGINYALYWFRYNASLSNGQSNIDGNNYFVLAVSGEAALLNVDATGVYLGGPSNRDLLGITIANASSAASIAIDRMIISWNGIGRLQRIVIDGNTVYSGNSPSPVDADITNVTFSPGSTYGIDRIRFSGNMSGSIVDIVFVMSDGSQTQQLRVLPAPGSVYTGGAGALVTISSTGKVSGSNIFRTIEASYNHSTGKITDYHEINSQITP